MARSARGRSERTKYKTSWQAGDGQVYGWSNLTLFLWMVKLLRATPFRATATGHWSNLFATLHWSNLFRPMLLVKLFFFSRFFATSHIRSHTLNTNFCTAHTNLELVSTSNENIFKGMRFVAGPPRANLQASSSKASKQKEQ